MDKVKKLQQGLKNMTELGADLKVLKLGTLLSQYSTLGILIYESDKLLHDVKSDINLAVMDIFYKCQSLQVNIQDELNSRMK